MPTEPQQTAPGPNKPREAKRPSLSMHEGIAVWCDCCSCEMEPYWAEVAEEMGIECSDYEAEDAR